MHGLNIAKLPININLKTQPFIKTVKLKTYLHLLQTHTPYKITRKIYQTAYVVLIAYRHPSLHID